MIDSSTAILLIVNKLILNKSKSCARHVQGLFIMKKKITIAFAALIVFAVAIITLCSFTTHTETIVETEHHTHVSCQGKHCSGTVGCNCSGFSPITNGKEWQKSYCKSCGHHKSYHR